MVAAGRVQPARKGGGPRVLVLARAGQRDRTARVPIRRLLVAAAACAAFSGPIFILVVLVLGPGHAAQVDHGHVRAQVVTVLLRYLDRASAARRIASYSARWNATALYLLRSAYRSARVRAVTAKPPFVSGLASGTTWPKAITSNTVAKQKLMTEKTRLGCERAVLNVQGDVTNTERKLKLYLSWGSSTKGSASATSGCCGCSLLNGTLLNATTQTNEAAWASPPATPPLTTDLRCLLDTLGALLQFPCHF